MMIDPHFAWGYQAWDNLPDLMMSVSQWIQEYHWEESKLLPQESVERDDERWTD